MILHLDAETFSGTGIKAGLSRYFADKLYQLLMLAWAIDHGPVQLWVPVEGQPLPVELARALQDSKTIFRSFKADFEWNVLRRLVGDSIRIEQFRCTMVQAWNLSFVGGLEKVQEQIGVSQDKRKLAIGRKLIHRFCKPAPASHHALRYDRHSHPEEWEQFKAYCIQDVVAERELELLLNKWPAQSATEDRLWHLDHKINQRGMAIDPPLVKSALRVDRQQKTAIRNELQHLTRLINPASNPQFLAWLQCFYHPDVDNVRKETLQELLKDPQLSSKVKKACRLKIQLSKTSNAKWNAMHKAVSPDDRLRNMYQFAGAQRTKRWAGRIVQPHNLPSSQYGNQQLYEAAVESIRCEDQRLLAAIWGDPAALLSQSIRGAFVAPPGRSLVVCDYASIESRVVAWMSGCERMNSLFRNGRDSYRDFATALFEVEYDLVTKAQRKFAKPPVLGCGYGLGGKGLLAYAEKFGVDMSLEESQRAVDMFRAVYPEIPDMWANMLQIIRFAIKNPGRWFSSNRVKAGLYTDDMLMIQLPSGRALHYFQPRWEKTKTPWGEWRDGFTYMGISRATLQWGRTSAHGGLIVENVVQAVARDILGDGLLKADDIGLYLIGHVHDEPICEEPTDSAELALGCLGELMAIPPSWAPDLLLGAAGWIGHRYRKE